MYLGYQLLIALRYLAGHKQLNAINWVVRISVIAIAIVCMAAVVVVSVYNGYVGLILKGTDQADPELIISPREGSSLSMESDSALSSALSLPSIECYSKVIETKGILHTHGGQSVVDVVGVDEDYPHVVDIKEQLAEGSFATGDSTLALNYPLDATGVPITLGVAIASEVGSTFYSGERQPELIFPKRKGMINPLAPASAFVSTAITPVGILRPLIEGVDKNIYVPLDRVQELLAYSPGEASYLALRLKPDIDKAQARSEIIDKLGAHRYRVLDREEQHPELSYLIKIEKMMTIFILLFILMLAAFNISSAISMLVLEKEEDIRSLQAMGARLSSIRLIFRTTGLLTALSGGLIGIALGLALCLWQQHTQLLMTGSGIGAIPFPIDIQGGDILLILAATISLTLLASLYAARLVRPLA